MTSAPMPPRPKATANRAPRLQDLSEPEQEALLDEMVRGYLSPSQEIIAAYAEVGRETERALKERDGRKQSALKAAGEL